MVDLGDAVHSNTATSTNNILLTHCGETGKLCYQVYVHGVGSTAVLSTDDIPESTWVHVVVVHKGRDVTLRWMDLTATPGLYGCSLV